MALLVLCGLLVAAGLTAAVAWGGADRDDPPPENELTPAAYARRFLWAAVVTVVGGLLAGITIIGGGGRLAMRLLAVTAGDGAQGSVTEAGEVVGEITTGGTLGFILFEGMFAGVTAAFGYMVVRRYLPAGRLGGLLYGAAVFVVLGPWADPIRRNNVDFDIVGPGWLALVIFAVMALAYGLTIQAVTTRLGAWLPLPARGQRLRRYAVALPMLVALPVTVMSGGVGVAGLVLSRIRPLVTLLRSARGLAVGRVLVGLVVLSGLPRFVLAVVDIAGRG